MYGAQATGFRPWKGFNTPATNLGSFTSNGNIKHSDIDLVNDKWKKNVDVEMLPSDTGRTNNTEQVKVQLNEGDTKKGDAKEKVLKELSEAKQEDNFNSKGQRSIASETRRRSRSRSNSRDRGRSRRQSSSSNSASNIPSKRDYRDVNYRPQRIERSRSRSPSRNYNKRNRSRSSSPRLNRKEDMDVRGRRNYSTNRNGQKSASTANSSTKASNVSKYDNSTLKNGTEISNNNDSGFAAYSTVSPAHSKIPARVERSLTILDDPWGDLPPPTPLATPRAENIPPISCKDIDTSTVDKTLSPQSSLLSTSSIEQKRSSTSDTHSPSRIITKVESDYQFKSIGININNQLEGMQFISATPDEVPFLDEEVGKISRSPIIPPEILIPARVVEETEHFLASNISSPLSSVDDGDDNH